MSRGGAEPSRRLRTGQRLYFRDQFRAARSATLRDSESFDEILFGIERLGQWISGKELDLGRYEPFLAKHILEPDRDQFERLYKHMRKARNAALHQGAFARNLAHHSVLIALMLEDGLMAEANRASDFMTSSVICAEPWQTVGQVRRDMLANSFSFLPIRIDGAWKFVADRCVAQFVRVGDPRAKRPMSLDKAWSAGLDLLPATTVGPESKIEEALAALELTNGTPVLVVNPESEEQLLGILTAFDLL